MSKQSRRDFIKAGAGAASAGMMLPVLNKTARGTTIVKQLTENAAGDGNVLVIVELGGGNDGLNTIVPLKQYQTYFSFRPLIAIPEGQVLPLYGSNTFNNQPTMGVTPDLAALKPVFDAGRVAVIQSAHYPNPNLSHESSRRNYYTGIPSTNIALAGSGWIGRHSALFGNSDNSLDTVGIGGVNKTLYASGAKVAGINAASDGKASGYAFATSGASAGERNNRINAARVVDATGSENPYDDLWEEACVDAIVSAEQVTAASATANLANYPTGNGFFYGLRLIAKLVASANPVIGTRVFHISMGGFDTHANQRKNDDPNPNLNQQALLHQRLAMGLKAFYDDLVLLGLADKVVVLVWSEFGRRPAANASFGTDHGTANNMLVLGGAIKGGVYGPDPDLTNLTGGNLRWYVDFRSVYTELIAKWLGGDPAAVLNASFPQLGFL